MTDILPRADQNQVGSHRASIVIAVVLIVVVFAGIFGLFLYFKKGSLPLPFLSSAPSPTAIPEEPTPMPKLTGSPPAVSSPVSQPTVKLTPKSSPKASPTTLASSPFPTLPPADSEGTIFESLADKFKVHHSPDRKLYEADEASGRRYTFWRSDSIITVHIGSAWSWQIPSRDFSPQFLVAGRSAFRFDLPAQTLIDFENNGQKYTIQCVHNGISAAKSECMQFAASLQLL